MITVFWISAGLGVLLVGVALVWRRRSVPAWPLLRIALLVCGVLGLAFAAGLGWIATQIGDEMFPGQLRRTMCESARLSTAGCECAMTAIRQLGVDKAKAMAIVMGGRTPGTTPQDVKAAHATVEQIKADDMMKVSADLLKCEPAAR